MSDFNVLIDNKKDSVKYKITSCFLNGNFNCIADMLALAMSRWKLPLISKTNEDDGYNIVIVGRNVTPKLVTFMFQSEMWMLEKSCCTKPANNLCRRYT